MVPLHCPKLESTELRYHGYDANILILQRLLLGISAPKNLIKFSDIKYLFVMCLVIYIYTHTHTHTHTLF